MSAFQITSGSIRGQVNDITAHDELPINETERQPAKNAAHDLADSGSVLIVIVSHTSVVPFAHKGEGTTDSCRYPIISEKFE